MDDDARAQTYGHLTSAGFAPYMAKRVRVAGLVPFEGTIIPEKVEAQTAGNKWEEVKIKTLM